MLLEFLATVDRWFMFATIRRWFQETQCCAHPRIFTLRSQRRQLEEESWHGMETDVTMCYGMLWSYVIYLRTSGNSNGEPCSSNLMGCRSFAGLKLRSTLPALHQQFWLRSWNSTWRRRSKSISTKMVMFIDLQYPCLFTREQCALLGSFLAGVEEDWRRSYCSDWLDFEWYDGSNTEHDTLRARRKKFVWVSSTIIIYDCWR